VVPRLADGRWSRCRPMCCPFLNAKAATAKPTGLIDTAWRPVPVGRSPAGPLVGRRSCDHVHSQSSHAGLTTPASTKNGLDRDQEGSASSRLRPSGDRFWPCLNIPAATARLCRLIPASPPVRKAIDFSALVRGLLDGW